MRKNIITCILGAVKHLLFVSIFLNFTTFMIKISYFSHACGAKTQIKCKKQILMIVPLIIVYNLLIFFGNDVRENMKGDRALRTGREGE